MPPVWLTNLRSGNSQFSLHRASACEGWRGMGRGHQGKSLRPFHVSQHHPSPTPPPPSPNPKQAGRRGAPGAAWAARLGLCGSVLDGGGQAEGAGLRAEDPQPGLDPQVHCPAGPAPTPRGSYRAATGPPPGVSLRRPHRPRGPQTRGQM